ncbi:hypothetical protein [Pseudogemmobacter bohemicus]|uniref:hypothetical protein n=1 Tax=Pseudogemmobacter bohemicus TaxID=2250708 RepID=UPI000DD2E18E|nr:hypothetical protein [Pseudogemmobacter bohemicus]
MKRRLILFLAVLTGLAVLAAGAGAALAGDPLQKGPGDETICAPRAKLLARLEHGRDFIAQGQGLRDAEAMMEVRADPDGNWLLLQNYADGLSCLVAMGEAWEGAAPVAAPETARAPLASGGEDATMPGAEPPAGGMDPA